MSGPDNKPDDTLLDDFLVGTSDLSQAYAKTQAITAPASLDAAVLTLAQQAPLVTPARWKRLRMPVALAATLVLGLSVMLNIQRDPEAYRAASAPAVMMEPTAEIPMASAVAPASRPVPAPAPTAPAAPAKAQRSSTAPAVPATPPPPAAPLPTDALAQADEMAMSPTAPAAAPASVESYSAMNGMEEAEAAPARDSLARKRMAPRAMMAEAAAVTVVTQESSEDWLTRIRALRDAGKEDEARKLWAEYRRAYPAAPVPADLQRYEPPQSVEKPVLQDPTPVQ